MPIQQYNDQGVDLLASVFQRRDEANFALSKAYGIINMIPGVVGNWTLASVGATTVPDGTGNGQSLTISGSPTPGNVGIAQYLSFNGSTDYLYRASGSTILPSTNFACGGWFRFAGVPGSTEGLIGKWVAATGQRQFTLRKTSTDIARLSISTDGTNATQTVDSDTAIVFNRWNYIAGYYLASDVLALCVNNNWYYNTTSIPASLFAGTDRLEVGLGAGNYFAGDAMLCWLAMRFSGISSANVRGIVRAVYEQTRAIFGA